jgi:large subunit ribosomal protein L18
MSIRTAVLRRKARNFYRIRKNNRQKYPFLGVHRSNKNIYAQITDFGGKVLVCSSSKSSSLAEELKGKSGILKAAIVGENLAQNSLALGLTRVVFCKGPYNYTGRVKSLAEAARKNGLVF